MDSSLLAKKAMPIIPKFSDVGTHFATPEHKGTSKSDDKVRRPVEGFNRISLQSYDFVGLLARLRPICLAVLGYPVFQAPSSPVLRLHQQLRCQNVQLTRLGVHSVCFSRIFVLHDPASLAFGRSVFRIFFETLPQSLTDSLAWNTGTCLYMIWTGLACLIQFINSIVWRSNVINWAPVWCDICRHFRSCSWRRSLFLVYL